MSNTSLGYILSEEADKDLEAIFDYTEREFDFNQAVKYLSELESVLNKLVLNPNTGRKRNEIKVGLLSIPEQEHIIFYRIVNNIIRVVRVLHGSRDLPVFF